MVKKIKYPKLSVRHEHAADVFLVANDLTVERYCLERGISLIEYEKHPMFSNNGSNYYTWWDGSKWNIGNGHRILVSKIIHQEGEILFPLLVDEMDKYFVDENNVFVTIK